MKRLISLIVCMTVVCVSVSCGNKPKETDNVSVSDSAVTEVTAESKTKTETETKTETKTTVKTTEKNESETTTESDESSKESKTEKVKTSATKNETEDKISEIATYEYIENADPTAFLGKWECEKTVIDGEEITDLMGIPVNAVFQLDIKDDHTASMAEYNGTEDTLSYMWDMVSETEIAIISENGDAMLLTVDGDYLVGTDIVTDDVMYLVRVNEFTHFDFEEFINGFNESDKSAFFGKWECEKEVINGEEITDIEGVPLNLMFQFDFKEDGTVLLGEIMSEIMEETSYSWNMLSKTEIALIDNDGDAMLLTLDGNYLVGTDDASDYIMYLVRVDEFTQISEFTS